MIRSPATIITALSSEDEVFARTELKTVIENMHDGSGDPKAYSPPSIAYDQSADERKYIAKTFEEGFNSGDPNCFGSVVRHLITSDCMVESFLLRVESDGSTSEEKESCIEGIEAVVTYFMGYIIAVPDCLFLIHEWKIFNRPSPSPPYHNTHSCLGFKFSFTGTKVFDVDTKCHRLAMTDSESISSSNSSSISTSAVHSIQFRERSRTSKYDHRKRGKVLTIGEHIRSNEMQDHQLINLEEEITNSDLKESMMDVDQTEADNVMGNGEGGGPPTTIQSSSSSTGDLYRTAQKVNVQGVMRFYLNEQQKIYKIHCIHIRGGSV